MASNTTMTVSATMSPFKPSNVTPPSVIYSQPISQKPSIQSTPTCTRTQPSRMSLGTFSPRPITSSLADEPGAIVRLRFEEKKRLQRMKLKRSCEFTDSEAPAPTRPAPML